MCGKKNEPSPQKREEKPKNLTLLFETVMLIDSLFPSCANIMVLQVKYTKVLLVRWWKMVLLARKNISQKKMAYARACRGLDREAEKRESPCCLTPVGSTSPKHEGAQTFGHERRRTGKDLVRTTQLPERECVSECDGARPASSEGREQHDFSPSRVWVQ